MFGARLWSFSQFLSPTIEPPVALVSAASATPSYFKRKQGLVKKIGERFTYLKNDSTNGGASLHVLKLSFHTDVGLKRIVSDTVIIIESAERQVFDVVQFHFYI